MKKIAAIMAISLAVSLPAFADRGNDNDTDKGHVVLGVGFTGGGETLATVRYVDGNSSNIKSGGLVAFYGGYDYRFSNKMSLLATVGYHYHDKSGSNGGLTFKRYPLEVLGYYGIAEQFRLGGGIRYVMNPRISSSGVLDGTNYEYDNTIGGILEAEYLYAPNAGIKLRAVNEKYKLKGTSTSVSGNHGGIYASYYF
jgi:hypothetical protein